MKYLNCYIELNGTQYYGYDLYTNTSPWKSRGNSEEPTMIVDSTVRDRMQNLNFSCIDKSIFPPKNSKIYLAPNCPYAVDDVRKNYIIKRKPDTGDYNVITPFKWSSYTGSIGYKVLAVVSSKKAIVTVDDTKDVSSMVETVKSFFPDIVLTDIDTIKRYDNWPDLFIMHNCPIYKSLLDNSLKKPCVSCENLDVSANNELTEDVLQLVYAAGNADAWCQDAEKNYILQLNVLNQHNWRQYSGTVSMLINQLLNGVAKRTKKYVSQQSKAVKEILNCYTDDFVSEKDFKMAQSFISRLLNMKDCQFASMDDVVSKVGHFGLSFYTFYKLFNNVVRITPNKYEGKTDE